MNTYVSVYRKNGLYVEIGVSKGGKVDEILVEQLLVPGRQKKTHTHV